LAQGLSNIQTFVGIKDRPNMKLKYKDLKHGMRITCEILSTKIDDAKISINDYGDMFICQNTWRGLTADDNLGYEYSWRIAKSEVEKDKYKIRIAGDKSGVNYKPKKKGGIMRELNILARKLLDADTKALMKRGVLDECLEVSNGGWVNSWLVNKFKKEMAVDARKENKEMEKKE